MAENKTKPTDASVDDYIASRANGEQRLSDLDHSVLAELVTNSVAEVKQRYE